MVDAIASSSGLVAQLSSHFPLTYPIPNPVTHPELISITSIPFEEDLLINPDNIRTWLNYIKSVSDKISQSVSGVAVDSSSVESSLLGPLATREARSGLQELTSLYERALAIFPNNFQLWKGYMQMRQSYVLGPVTSSAIKAKKVNEKRAAATKTDVTEMLAFAEGELEWEGGLDGVVGFEEWKSLVATGERMMACLSNVSIHFLSHLLKLRNDLSNFSCSCRYLGS